MIARSRIGHSPGSRPQALRVATYGQLVASLKKEPYPFAEVQSAYSTTPANRMIKFRIIIRQQYLLILYTGCKMVIKKIDILNGMSARLGLFYA